MVMRKEEPEPQADLVPAPLSKANPPYPITPLDEHPPVLPGTSNTPGPFGPNLNSSPAFTIKTPDDAKKQKDQKTQLEEDSESSDDEWDQSDDDDFEEVNAKDIPDALKPAGGKTQTKNALPDALRAGPPAGIPIKQPFENISPMPTGASSASYGAMSTVSEQSNGSLPLQTNNPYLKMQPTGQSNWGGESSQQIWGDSQGQAAKYGEPVELPAYNTPNTPAHELAKLDLNNNIPSVPDTKPVDQPPLIAVNSPTPLTSPQSEQAAPTRKASNPWSTEAEASLTDATPNTNSLPQNNYSHAGPPAWRHQQQDWERSDTERKEREEAAQRAAQAHNPIEQPVSTNPFIPPQPTNLPPPPPIPQDEEQAPALPPRRSQEETPPAMPPRPINTTIAPGTVPGPESPNTMMNRQRKEHYQIKQIRWHDVNKPGIRTSPILTQNLNGPCPLLALVNALVLSTPSGIDTALVETLRTRETVSLGLLLDAVFDELMSGRRGTAAQELPDVSDLYKFLLALHTGLNVNPMFVADTDATHGNSAVTNSSAGKAGGFENTQDMKLYRTFNIPLMHGWLPEADSEAAAAFNRVAKSYETSQYVQFQEEELEAKLQSGDPLTPDEQQMFTDILTIKEFLQQWPTQLTDHGLKVLKNSLQSGQVAILFRNDHFSTLFKDPRTDKLLTLVTDQGYSSHDEIVWESLVDVHGQGSELFSGDFRPVGNHNPSPQAQQTQNLLDVDNGQGWTTVEPRRNNQQRSSSAPGPTQSNEISQEELSRAEQEDHDLALALQLQEEEEDRQRRETAQRERDNQASQTAIAAQSQARPENPRTSRIENPPVIPPRRNNITGHRPNNDPAPPPTYEEASTARPYHPPQGHPANPQAPIPPQGSAYQATNANRPPHRPMGPGRPPVGSPTMGRPGRRHSAGQNGEEQREKCVVM